MLFLLLKSTRRYAPPRLLRGRSLRSPSSSSSIASFSASKPAGRRVELRSDTFTEPCQNMRDVIWKAGVGDDVYGEDKNVVRLEETTAGLLGKEAGMFATSGTMTNLLGLAAHCKRGDEVILGNRNHIFLYEGGGASSLLGVSFHTIPTLPDGTNKMEDIEEAIREDNIHFPRTRLIAVENTHNKANGTPLSLNFLSQVGALCRAKDLIFHVDGARLMNGSVAMKTPAADLVKDADSISLCLSKGLGAPIGSVLVGSKDVIKEAKRQRKVLGGGWRQAGMMAAAGLYALENNVERLERDHENAQALAKGLSLMPCLFCDPSTVFTNIVYFRVLGMSPDALVEKLKNDYNIWVGGSYKGGDTLRAVTNLMVNAEDIQRALLAVQEVVEKGGK